MHDPRVDDYLDRLDPTQAALAQALRQLVRAAAPRAVETFKWAQPVFEHGGPLCWIKAHKGHVTLGFWRGKQLPSGAGVIEGSGQKMGHIKVRSAAEIQPTRLKALIREAVALNVQLGDPTRSG
jgi:hypothetical protein